MAPEPFLKLPLRSCRDLLQVRHCARQIAQLLHFSPHEVICIAAGAFAVAEQGKTLLRRAEICFMLADGHLDVAACPLRPLSQLPSGLYTLRKLVPRADQVLAGEDIAWLLAKVAQLAPTTLQEEITRQNQETLLLLTVLHDAKSNVDSSVNPSAA